VSFQIGRSFPLFFGFRQAIHSRSHFFRDRCALPTRTGRVAARTIGVPITLTPGQCLFRGFLWALSLFAALARDVHYCFSHMTSHSHSSQHQTILREKVMLSWALAFLVIALIAAVLGFGVVAGTAAWVAKVLFVVFLVLFVVSLVAGRGRPAV